jgi:hypothetical protein
MTISGTNFVYAVRPSDRIIDTSFNGNPGAVLADAGLKKSRIGWSHTNAHAFAAVKEDPKMSIFKIIWLSITHTKMKIGNDYYFLNNNSIKKRLGNRALECVKKWNCSPHLLTFADQLKFLFDFATADLSKDHRSKMGR